MLPGLLFYLVLALLQVAAAHVRVFRALAALVQPLLPVLFVLFRL